MGYLAKQAFEVLEINEEKSIDVAEDDENEINESLRETNWNRMHSIYEVK